MVCSKECQVQHWKQHKPACTELKKWYDKWKEAMSKVLPDGTALDTKEGPCAICLEETITNPVVLPCGHAFCFSCVGKYQNSSDSDSKEKLCPYCRGEIPNVGVKAIDRAKSYGDRAVRSSKGSGDQKKYAKLALAELDSILGLVDPENKEFQMKIICGKARIMVMADQPEEAIKVAKEVLLLHEKYSGILTFEEVAETKYWKAEAYSDCGKWKDAVKSYKPLIKEYKQRREYPSSEVFIGYSQALYELHKYDEAIEYGTLAIELNRSREGVHKYVALSQKALGDIDEAKKTMSRAILYEEHWDKDNMQKNKELLRELNNL